METQITERDKRIGILEVSLREQTQARIDREHRIRELEMTVTELQGKITQLETDRR